MWQFKVYNIPIKFVYNGYICIHQCLCQLINIIQLTFLSPVMLALGPACVTIDSFLWRL